MCVWDTILSCDAQKQFNDENLMKLINFLFIFKINIFCELIKHLEKKQERERR